MVERLSIAEFERLLSRGRGKAILHLQQHDAAPYRDAIRRCCLTNATYPSYASPRIPYFMQVIDLSGDVETICNAVIHALHRDGDETRHFSQRFLLLNQFARRGYQMARQAMYAWCRVHHNPREMSSSGLEPLIELDGIDAFLFLLDPRQSGFYPDLETDEFNTVLHFLKTLETKLGEHETRQALKEVTHNQPALYETINTLYARWDAGEEARAQKRAEYQREDQKKDWTDLPYAQLRQEIQNGVPDHMSSYGFEKWGEKASEEDILAVAIDFITLEPSRQVWISYASMFRKRVFPLDDFSRLFAMADYINLSLNPFSQDPISHVAFSALQNISHPEVREFALELIEEHQSMGHAVGLLTNNFEDGDWSLIAPLFDHVTQEEDCHNLGFSILEVFRKNPTLEAVPVLIRTYDATPCSFCRSDTVKSLVSLNALPDWMANECRYDANLDLRAYAERGFTDASDD